MSVDPLSGAERQRRYAAHRKGDHSLCAPDRDCASAPAPALRYPARLGVRGRELWVELTTVTTAPAQRVLIEEACRIADRLERLDRILAGDERAWLTLVADESELELTVVVDKPLAEARQQQIALKAIMGELRQAAKLAALAPKPAAATAASSSTSSPAPAPLPTGVGDLSKRIRERQTAG